MKAFINRAFDAVRLAKELEIAERRIEELRTELQGKLLGPSYREVQRDFNVSHISDRVVEQVIHDLSPMVEQSMIRVMKQVSSGLQRDHSFRMNAAVSYDMMSNVHDFTFEMPAMGTRIKAML